MAGSVRRTHATLGKVDMDRPPPGPNSAIKCNGSSPLEGAARLWVQLSTYTLNPKP